MVARKFHRSVKAREPFLPFPLPVLNSALGLMFFRASCLCPENSVARGVSPCRDCVAKVLDLAVPHVAMS